MTENLTIQERKNQPGQSNNAYTGKLPLIVLTDKKLANRETFGEEIC